MQGLLPPQRWTFPSPLLCMLHADGEQAPKGQSFKARQTRLCVEQAGLGALGGFTSGMVTTGKKLLVVWMAQASFCEEIKYVHLFSYGMLLPHACTLHEQVRSYSRNTPTSCAYAVRYVIVHRLGMHHL